MQSTDPRGGGARRMLPMPLSSHFVSRQLCWPRARTPAPPSPCRTTGAWGKLKVYDKVVSSSPPPTLWVAKPSNCRGGADSRALGGGGRLQCRQHRGAEFFFVG